MAPGTAAQRQLTRHDVTSATACSVQGTGDFSRNSSSKIRAHGRAEPGALQVSHRRARLAAGELGAGVPQQP